ncbi:hypothetical protein SAMN04487944_12269 [Gracilibacillus ureilyticus]|uniref:Uncharacterized protein n=1 Tax=Gracilibacillus ureilyticus TaxID=531814 RepID=A0A1H9VAN2_9BACI|nr:hypothetical protein [Gracilibacillus ureilyticus]SES18638.1 hypothetical protein SAMN04487944_12269 [Gracilibacillus ureilyticus]
MEFDFGNFSIVLPPLHISIIAIIVIFMLIRWSKQLETRRFTVFFYFLVSCYIAPVYSRGTDDGVFVLWLPLGFIVIVLYLYSSKRSHPSKIKASILGLCIAVYQLILQYAG